MFNKRPTRPVVVSLALAAILALMPSALAVEAFGKWRFELRAGGIDAGDSIRSDAANVMILLGPDGSRVGVGDPRPDAISTLEGTFDTDARYELRASYGLAQLRNAEIVLDVGVGYYSGVIENIEFAYALDIEDRDYFTGSVFDPSCAVTDLAGIEVGLGQEIERCTAFSADRGGETLREEWRTQLINAGEVEVYPISIGGYIRWTPTKRLNPYLGANIGYMFASLETTEEWERVANLLDASLVDDVVNGFGSQAAGSRALAGNVRDLQRPTITADDGIFFEVRGGLEWQWRPKISIFFETTFSWAAEQIQIRVDGQKKLGQPVPDGLIADDRTDDAFPRGGRPAYIICGGVTDIDVDVPVNGDICPGAGEYYLNGGDLDFGGFSALAGVRFTL